jgi:aspartate racemase
MRCLGVIGGMSWESTQLYYRQLNQCIAARLGGLHSARLVLHSVDFAPLAALQQQGDWNGAAALMADAARGLAAAGAEGLVIASNTMHRVADAVAAAVPMPLLHIADATGAAVAAAGVRRVAFLGTRYSMDDAAIVTRRLRERHGLDVLLPDAAERATVHRVIYDELCRGVVAEASRDAYAGIIGRLRGEGAEGVILGCTEITLLIDAATSPLPVFDSTALHVAAAAGWMLDEA